MLWPLMSACAKRPWPLGGGVVERLLKVEGVVCCLAVAVLQKVCSLLQIKGVSVVVSVVVVAGRVSLQSAGSCSSPDQSLCCCPLNCETWTPPPPFHTFTSQKKTFPALTSVNSFTMNIFSV